MPHSKTMPPKYDQIRKDSLRKMTAYQLACDLIEDGWDDAEKLVAHPITVDLALQLYTALGSITANLAEGYSRSSGRDRARIFEYALGSARESIAWYDTGSKVLGSEIVADRQARLSEIRAIMLTAIPKERDRDIRPEKT